MLFADREYKEARAKMGSLTDYLLRERGILTQNAAMHDMLGA